MAAIERIDVFDIVPLDDLPAYLAANGLRLVDGSLRWRGMRATVEAVGDEKKIPEQKTAL